MLQQLDELIDDKEKLEKAVKQAQESNKPPLRYLLDEVAPMLSKSKQDALDDDVDLLHQLVDDSGGRLGWDILEPLRRYTINFNPAVEAEIVPATDQADRQPERSGGTTALLPGSKDALALKPAVASQGPESPPGPRPAERGK